MLITEIESMEKLRGARRIHDVQHRKLMINGHVRAFGVTGGTYSLYRIRNTKSIEIKKIQ